MLKYPLFWSLIRIKRSKINLNIRNVSDCSVCFMVHNIVFLKMAFENHVQIVWKFLSALLHCACG